MIPFLEIVEIRDTGKTKVFDVRSSSDGTPLGEVKWYGPWRRYVFFPYANRLFDAACLTEITTHIENLMTARKASP